MASAEVDIGSLSPAQQTALEQYTAVTNQDVSSAISLLQRTQWNVQIAISRFFDGEPETDPVEEALNAMPRDARTQETLADSLNSRPSSSRHPAAPRIVPPPNPEVAYRPGFPLNLVLAPFNLASYFAHRFLRLLVSFIPFLPALLSRFTSPHNARLVNRRPLKPRDTAARFIREFEEEYGSKDLSFREMGYAHCLDEAKRDVKFLLVVIISPEHDDTASYVHDTLLAPEVVSYLQNPDNNIILWGGSVQDSEAYQIATAFHVTKFPYAALIANTPNSRGGATNSFSSSSSGMSVIAPLSGLLSPAEFLAKLRRAIDSHTPEITRLRSERAEREASRSLRQQQDSAYERSLAKDRDRARQKREEEERRKNEEDQARKVEEEREQAAHKLEDWKIWRAARIQPEPDSDDQNAIRVSVRLQSGDRAIRRFAGDAKVEEIYAFVECFDILKAETASKEVSKPTDFAHTYPFQLVSPMPRTVYDIKSDAPVRQLIGRSANLIVESVEDADED